MDKKKYDFSGWATKCNIRCSDGRTIKSGAFKAQDGETVPVVWNHDHKGLDSVLGHALLENREEGVYCYCSLNDTELGKKAKELVKHGDIRALSIYANQLKQDGNDVIHGKIREVSLVLAGANMGAYIDTIIAHSDDADEEAVVYSPYDKDGLTLCHEENGEIKMEEEIKHAGCGTGCSEKKEEKKLEHSKEESMQEEPAKEEPAKEETIQDVFDSLSEKQKDVVYYLAGVIAENAKNGNLAQHSDDMEDNMKKNVFEGEETFATEELAHSAMNEILTNAKRCGSMRDAYNDYVASGEENAAIAHSITDISNLFPEVQSVNKAPLPIARRTDWVGKVMGGVHHTPFSRVKSTAANLTGDDARAKGYVKANQKVEEVIVALKRSTTPQTVYKLQKIDRDDVLDITDFDVVAYLKVEMRGMLEEELARAILIGDGRSSSSNDKINPLNIRPILGDNSVYTIAKNMTRDAGEDNYAFAKRFIREAIKARKDYKGSGNVKLFVTEDLFTDMLLIEDTNGRVIYDTEAKLATALRVNEVVSVPVFANVVRTDSSSTYDYTLMGVFVDLQDYNVGADKGGQVTMFDDFDINYNKQEYLIETRCSGALVKPYSAITFEEKSAHQNG